MRHTLAASSHRHAASHICWSNYYLQLQDKLKTIVNDKFKSEVDYTGVLSLYYK